MAKKKSGKSTSQKKPQLPSSATLATQPTPTAAIAAAIKQECERASNALHHGNQAKALKLLKEATPKFQNEPLFHREAARFFVQVAGYFENHTIKQRHLKTAAESAKKAVSLSPNSVEFACFYATILLDVATEPQDFEQVAVECERALALKNPIDPATEEIVWDKTMSFTAVAKEGRIAAVQATLKDLVHKSNIGKLSLWLKDWTGKGGGDEDKLKLAQMRRSMEVFDFSGTARVAPKTPEEKRKEVEGRVAALRLIHLTTTEQEAVEKSNQEDSGSGSGSPRG